MRFLWNRVLRRFTILGRIADFFLVAGIALRFAYRRGWVSDELMRSVGLDTVVQAKLSSDTGAAGSGELALGVGALWRMLRRRRSRRLL